MADVFTVYCHTSPSGKRYVGFTSRGADLRWRAHVSDARKGSQFAFHRAIRKYGAENFTHEVLEAMTTEAGAKHAERLWIRELDSYASGYNATFGGDGVLGSVRSSEQRARLSAAKRGSTPWNKGRKCTPEECAKNAASHRGQKHSDATKNKMSAAHRASEKTAAHNRAKIGKNASAETRSRMSATHKQRYAANPELKAANSALHTGRKCSPETKARMAEARKRYWAGKTEAERAEFAMRGGLANARARHGK